LFFVDEINFGLIKGFWFAFAVFWDSLEKDDDQPFQGFLTKKHNF